MNVLPKRQSSDSDAARFDRSRATMASPAEEVAKGIVRVGFLVASGGSSLGASGISRVSHENDNRFVDTVV